MLLVSLVCGVSLGPLIHSIRLIANSCPVLGQTVFFNGGKTVWIENEESLSQNVFLALFLFSV